MLSFGFGKRPKHRKFDYLPRYYDAEKETLEKRINQYKGDLSDEAKMKERISSQLRHRYIGDENYRKSQSKKSTLRVFYILILLLVISYFILTSDRIQIFLEMFDK